MPSALNQYTDLFLVNRDLVCRGSAPALNALRDSALASLEKSLLPAKGSENYELADLEAWLSPDFGINLARVPIDVNPAASFSCGVPSLASSPFLIVNDSWIENEASRNGIPEGVEIGSIAEFARKDPHLVAEYY
ncbi:MAG: Fe-S cluster assembly protein SufD, partial [Muribaculaceae bacterium]|nr:Fe-S cluster assembly protein SufD [Muribaculaceae bacterium]